MLIEKINQTKNFILENIQIHPEAGIVLGSGLGEIVELTLKVKEIPYAEIPNFVKPTVAGHEGKLICSTLNGKNILIMQGRFHFYEGYSMEDITFPIRVMAKLGIKYIILTSAVGAINKKYKPGDVVVITDHINFMGDNPLRGECFPELGDRFQDLTFLYSKRLIKLACDVARKNKIKVQKGVYIAVRGPSYETPQEIKSFRKLGADVVGMSLVPEAIVAKQMGLEVLGLAFVSNMAAGILKKPLSHEEVIETAKKSADKIKKIIIGVISEI